MQSGKISRLVIGKWRGKVAIHTPRINPSFRRSFCNARPEISEFKFEIIHQSKKSRARVGRIHTPHGIIETPNFVPVATNATVKSIDSQRMVDLGSLNEFSSSKGVQLMFCNTYHLLLHPGPELIQEAGGLHKFMNFPRPIITDSGGFQVFSLNSREGNVSELKGKGGKKYEGMVLKISEEGVLFRSYRDGTTCLLSPEFSVQCQKAFGSDIIIPLDELPAYGISDEKLRSSFDRTHRSLDTHLANRKGQAMYAVIHGGSDRSLRQESIDILAPMGFDGFAIGGSLGKDREEMFPLVDFVAERIPKGHPIHLLGIGDYQSIESCIPFGIDTFDSSFPTRLGRHGNLFTQKGILQLGKVEHKHNFGPIESHCTCYTCQRYSVAYLHHLLKAHENAFHFLGTIHNLHFLFERFGWYRQMILEDRI